VGAAGCAWGMYKCTGGLKRATELLNGNWTEIFTQFTATTNMLFNNIIYWELNRIKVTNYNVTTNELSKNNMNWEVKWIKIT